jgi:hypothetical protein
MEDGVKRRIEFDKCGEIDEVVSDGGGHLERMRKKGWFLNLVNADGSSTAIWFEGNVTLWETRPTPARGDDGGEG